MSMFLQLLPLLSAQLTVSPDKAAPYLSSIPPLGYCTRYMIFPHSRLPDMYILNFYKQMFPASFFSLPKFFGAVPVYFSLHKFHILLPALSSSLRAFQNENHLYLRQQYSHLEKCKLCTSKIISLLFDVFYAAHFDTSPNTPQKALILIYAAEIKIVIQVRS